MVDRLTWEKEVRKTIDKIKTHKKKYSVEVNGIKIHIFPNVFSPAYFTDSNWIASAVSKIVGKHSLLEIGTGTGIIALFAALKGAKVTVTDINPEAIKNAKYNFEKQGLKLKAYSGDMYAPVPAQDKFDFIFWNHPWGYANPRYGEVLQKSVFDYKYSGLKKYVEGAKSHLKPSGRLLLATSNFALSSEIEKIAAENCYKIKLLKEK
ncbi:MAG: methyltransferase, partial [Candidatus ainarchaeum sp.]|nr:methyltransferase [Candidatus ainarchaeum sp.]